MHLDNLSQLLWHDFGLKAVIATEIEFYLHGAGAKLQPEEILTLIRSACADAGIALASAEAERGPDQYEVALPYSPDVNQVAFDTERFKSVMKKAFAPYGEGADFSAKPMRDAPGSGLHVHVHLEDREARNVFSREGENFSPVLLHSIGGLMELMNPCMSIFAPSPESYDRFLFTANRYLVCPTASNVPSTVSWGTNNRTVAVRLPNKPIDDKHIEHRVSGSDADVACVIAAILAGVHYGLTRQCNPGPPVYGDASLPQYELPKLMISLEDALDCKLRCDALGGYALHLDG